MLLQNDWMGSMTAVDYVYWCGVSPRKCRVRFIIPHCSDTHTRAIDISVLEVCSMVGNLCLCGQL